MLEIDHSVVYQRQNSNRGSGTVVHYSSTYIALEIYSSRSSILLNEVFDDIRITSGRSIVYDGMGVVCNVIDYSSIQIVTLFLKDSWIAFGSKDIDADNLFEAERFLAFNKREWVNCDQLEQSFCKFQLLLTQMVRGLAQSRSAAKSEDVSEKRTALALMADTLFETYQDLEDRIREADDESLMVMGELFKQHIFPLCGESKFFNLFHSVDRPPYLHFGIYDLQTMNDDFWVGKLEGVLLDVFFAKHASFNALDERCRFFAERLRETMESRLGKLNILVIGSDSAPMRIVEKLPNQLLSRLNIKVWDFYDGPISDVDVHTKDAIRRKSATMGFETKRVDFESLMTHLYVQSDVGLGQFDHIFVSTAFEPLSSKILLHMVQLLTGILNEGGNLCYFTDSKGKSSIRENWLLHYRHNYESPDWKNLIRCNIECSQEELEFGTHTCIHKPKEAR